MSAVLGPLSANSSALAKSGCSLLGRVLFEQSSVHSSLYCLWLCLHCSGRTEWQRQHACKSDSICHLVLCSPSLPTPSWALNRWSLLLLKLVTLPIMWALLLLKQVPVEHRPSFVLAAVRETLQLLGKYLWDSLSFGLYGSQDLGHVLFLTFFSWSDDSS